MLFYEHRYKARRSNIFIVIYCLVVHWFVSCYSYTWPQRHLDYTFIRHAYHSLLWLSIITHFVQFNSLLVGKWMQIFIFEVTFLLRNVYHKWILSVCNPFSEIPLSNQVERRFTPFFTLQFDFLIPKLRDNLSTASIVLTAN